MKSLNKLGLACLVVTLFAVGGCGKKKESSKESTKKIASADLGENSENLLDDKDIANFAFVDDETIPMVEDKKQTAANEKKADDKLVALVDEDEFEVDEDSTLPEDEAVAPKASAFKTVYFDFNKNNIRKDQQTAVNSDIERAQEAVKQGKKVVIEGHCDQIGSATYNLALSQRRAEAVKKQMAQRGLDQNKIKTIGLGYERPVVWSDAKSRSTLIKELALNRRAEVLVD